MPIRRNYTDIRNNAKTRIQNNTPITDFTQTGVVSNLIDVVAVEGETIYDQIEYLHRIMDPTRNTGVDLDNLGFIFGRDRSSASTAMDLSTTNFYFFIDPAIAKNIIDLLDELYPLERRYNARAIMFEEGYIDNIENPTKFTIPRGIIISTKTNAIRYRTLDDIELTESNSEVYCPVTALAEGAGSNVQANTLVKHSLNQYLSIKDLSRYIMCSNRYPITSGKSSENDDDYRYNLSLSRINYGINEVSVRQTALAVPGVRNILFQRGRYGNGTFNLVVEGTSPIVSEGLLEVVRDRVSDIIANSDEVYVTRPEYLGVEIMFDLSVGIEFNIDTLREQVRDNVITYINNIPIGGTLVWNELVGIVMNNDGVEDFILNYFKIGEYDVFNKLNKNQIVLRPSNQNANELQKFYTDTGLCSMCVTQGN